MNRVGYQSSSGTPVPYERPRDPPPAPPWSIYPDAGEVGTCLPHLQK